MKPVFLIGFMGSGKSTVGRGLSKVLKQPFVDLDDFIEEKHNTKIIDIFRVYGEKKFRKYESEALKDAANFQIVSTGGGVVEMAMNIETMKASGTIIYLYTPFEEVNRRLKEDYSRPLWEGDLEERKALYDRRILLYEKYANFTIWTNNKKVGEVIAEIENLLLKD